MLNQLKAEVKKVTTIRSTYVILAICLVLVAFVGFYVMGFHGVLPRTSPNMIAEVMTGMLPNIVFLLSLVGVLLVTHEYRFNTIMYTLTLTRARLHVLLAKMIVVTVFAILATLLLAACAALFTYLGAAVHGTPLVAQSIPYSELWWRFAFFGWGYAMFGLLFAFIIRNQVGAIAAFILLPDLLTGLLGLLLKENSAYLPFSALAGILHKTEFSYAKSVAIVLIYLAIGWIVAAYLFKKRDAN